MLRSWRVSGKWIARNEGFSGQWSVDGSIEKLVLSTSTSEVLLSTTCGEHSLETSIGQCMLPFNRNAFSWRIPRVCLTIGLLSSLDVNRLLPYPTSLRCLRGQFRDRSFLNVIRLSLRPYPCYP